MSEINNTVFKLLQQSSGTSIDEIRWQRQRLESRELAFCFPKLLRTECNIADRAGTRMHLCDGDHLAQCGVGLQAEGISVRQLPGSWRLQQGGTEQSANIVKIDSQGRGSLAKGRASAIKHVHWVNCKTALDNEWNQE